MATSLLLLALLTSTVAAVRGIWSPCGLSMLSSITPMTEAGRGNRFATTAAWFTVGGLAGGLTLGGAAALGAVAIDAAGLSLGTRLGIGATLALLTASIDLGVAGVELPLFKRQVNDAWLRRYRSWVYGAGFGWQIGVGIATYIMTGAVFLTIGLAALTASPGAALAVGATFGMVRGSAVWLGRSATTPAALGEVHRRLEAAGPWAMGAAAGVQVLAATVLAGLAWHPVASLVVLAAAATAFGLHHRAGLARGAVAPS